MDELKSFDLDGVITNLGFPKNIIQMLVDEFLDSIDSDFDQLYKSSLSNNLDKVQKDAHRIKGAALNLRFDKLGHMMREIEHRSKNGDSNFGDLIEESKKEIEVIKQIVKDIF